MELESRAGLLVERYPDSAVAWKALGAALQVQGKEHLFALRKVAELLPEDPEARISLGNSLRACGRLDEAVASYRRVLELKPARAEAHNNLGNALQELGQLADAAASYRRALAIKPDYVDAHSNLGVAQQDLGQLDDAVASYRAALAIRSDIAEVHNNLGAALQDLGQLSEAAASYRRALEINPDYAEALNNLALLSIAQGQPMMALDIIRQSLQIKATREAKSLFVACVKRLRITHDDSDLRATLVRALTEPWGRPTYLARAGMDLVKLDPDVGKGIARAAEAWPARLAARDLFGHEGVGPRNVDPLLCALLDSTPLCDIAMERFLTLARSAMLEAATRMTVADSDVGATLSFCSALARQCFINEYVFMHTDDEIRDASALRDRLAATLDAGAAVPALWPIAVAAYCPLGSVPFAHQLLENQWPAEVAAVLLQQIREPREELRLRTTIPRLTDIDDNVSLRVQNQYEESPYPRWTRATPAGEARSIAGYLCELFPLAPFTRHDMSDGIDILIAGCGTGQHSIETAQRFARASVLAVDLSISSLCYAKRKTQELGLTSIEYAQADLLRLGSLGRSFDLIESSGVLHHLAEPLLGWQILLSLLRPGGFIRLGFYSEVARRNIVKARAFIAARGYEATPAGIRRCRQELLDLGKTADLGNTLTTPDFFCNSTCRDLLFHVQEQRMTLTGIDAFLRANNLTLLGFDVDPEVLRAYRQRFPGDPAATRVDQWQVFEHENPDTFFGMYDFWIQKSR